MLNLSAGTVEPTCRGLRKSSHSRAGEDDEPGNLQPVPTMAIGSISCLVCMIFYFITVCRRRDFGRILRLVSKDLSIYAKVYVRFTKVPKRRPRRSNECYRITRLNEWEQGGMVRQNENGQRIHSKNWAEATRFRRPKRAYQSFRSHPLTQLLREGKSMHNLMGSPILLETWRTLQFGPEQNLPCMRRSMACAWPCECKLTWGNKRDLSTPPPTWSSGATSFLSFHWLNPWSLGFRWLQDYSTIGRSSHKSLVTIKNPN